MSTLAVTAAQVALVEETDAETRTYIAANTITAGQVVYETSAGKADLARANAVNTSYVAGIALKGASAGQAITVVQRGSIIGLDLSGVAYNGFAYLSSGTAGAVDGAAATGTGNVVVPLGRVLAMPDAPTLTKVLFVDIPFNQILTALP